MQRNRRTGKAILTVLLTTVMVFSSYASPVFAKEGYYFSKLSATEKSHFRTMDADGGLKNGTNYSVYLGSIDQKTFSNSLSAFLLDNVDLFWLGSNFQVTAGTLDFDKSVDWKTGSRKSRLSSDIAAVSAAVDAMAAQADKKSSVYDKLLYVHDQLIKTNVYNSSAAKALFSNPDYPSTVTSIPWTPLSALLSSESPVCEGYSRAFKLVCDKLGINCIIVGGTGHTNSRSEGHMWNMVQIDGKWYGVDCTWDDPVVSGKSGVVSGHERTDYFLVGSSTKVDGKTFAASHVASDDIMIPGNTLKYPTLEKNAYSGGGSTPTPAKNVKIKKVSVKPSAKSVGKDKRITLTPVITPSTATNQSLTWKIKSGVAEFVESSTTTWKGEGKCTLKCTGTGDIKIEVTANDGSKKKATVTIKGPKAPTGITVKPKPSNVTKPGGTVKLTATVSPKGTAVYDKVVWEKLSKNAQIVESDKNTCTIKAIDSGKITITAKVKSGSKWMPKKVTLKGLEAPKSVTLKKPKKTASGKKFSATKLAVGDEFTLTANVTNKNAVDKTLVWSCDKPTVATVENGNVVCIGKGKATITVKALKNSKAKKTLKITVK